MTFGTNWSSTDYMRDYYTRIPISIEKNGITVTFSYGIEGSRMYCDTTQIRLYNKNTLTFKAKNNGIKRIEFSVPEKSEDKEFIPSVGNMNGNVWTAPQDTLVSSVEFTSTYTSSWPATNANKHIQIEEARIEVLNEPVIDRISSVVNTNNRHIYNMYGVRVSERNLRPGIFFCSNKKFIVK